MVFLAYHLNCTRTGKIPFYDAALVALSLATLFYVGSDFTGLMANEYANSTAKGIAIGAVISILVLEGHRRAAATSSLPWSEFS